MTTLSNKAWTPATTIKTGTIILSAILLLALAMPQSAYGIDFPQTEKKDKLAAADMSDVKTLGIYGKVQTVKFTGLPQGYDDRFEFDSEGKMVSRGNKYGTQARTYSDATHYSQEGWGDYSIKFGATNRNNTPSEKWDNKIEYKFDLHGRLVFQSIKDADGNGTENTYTYIDNNAFPASEVCSNITQDGDWTENIRYEYLKFDKYGNWTKRNAIITSTGWYEDADGVHETKNSETVKQTAEYTYYDGAVALATKDAAQKTTAQLKKEAKAETEPGNLQKAERKPFSLFYTQQIKPLVEWRTGKDAKYFAALEPIETSGFWFILSVLIVIAFLIANIVFLVRQNEDMSALTFFTFAYGFLYLLWHFYNGFLTMVVYGFIGLLALYIALLILVFLIRVFLSEKGVHIVAFLLSLVPLSLVALMWKDVYAVDSLIQGAFNFINAAGKPYQIVAAIMQENIAAVREIIPATSLVVFFLLYILIRKIKSNHAEVVLQYIFIYAGIIAVALLNMLVFSDDIVPFGLDQFWWKPVFGILYFVMSVLIFFYCYRYLINCFQYAKYKVNSAIAFLSVIIPVCACVYCIIPLAIFGVVFAFSMMIWGSAGWMATKIGEGGGSTSSQKHIRSGSAKSVCAGCHWNWDSGCNNRDSNHYGRGTVSEMNHIECDKHTY